MPATAGGASGPSLQAFGLTGSLETGLKTRPELGAVKAEGVGHLVTLAASVTPPPTFLHQLLEMWWEALCTLPDGDCRPHEVILRGQTPGWAGKAFAVGGSCLCPARSSHGHLHQVDRLERPVVQALGCHL